MVTLADLHKVAGVKSTSATTKAILAAFNKYAAAYDVTTPKRIALCLAHISVETGGFRRLDENLNYSAKRLREVWSARFPTDAVAKKYANKPQALANFVYGGRMGNKGRENAGWLYRGSGPGQVTGYDNFLRSEKETGIPFVAQPDLMRDPDTGMKATLMLWKKWGMNALADKDQVTASRKKWNGGTHGLNDVIAAWKRGLARNLSVSAATEKPVPVPTPKPVKPAPGEDPVYDSVQAIRNVQERLLALGYTEVGKPDGSLGNMTQAAILLFRQDNGLPLSAEIDDGLILALATAPQRKLVNARENATEKEVVEKVPEARPAWWLKVSGFFGGIVSLIVAAFDGVVGNIGAASIYVQPVIDLFDSVPGWAWALLVALVAFGMWYAGRHGLAKSTEAFQSGARR